MHVGENSAELREKGAVESLCIVVLQRGVGNGVLLLDAPVLYVCHESPGGVLAALI